MSFNPGKLLKSSFGTAAATLASRICGLLRVRLEASILGGDALASAWFLAQMIPNLFRRLLGEGALGTALIPLTAEIEAADGIPVLRRKLAAIFAALGAILAGIVLIFSLAALVSGRFIAAYGNDFWRSDRFTIMLKLLPLLMPYAFFICLTGVISAVLNYAKIFVRPALTALLFNIFMIAGLSIAWFGAFPAEKVLPFLAVLTPLAGAVQLFLMGWMLHSCGFFPDFRKGFLKEREIIRKLFTLATPGILGYGVLQLSFIIDRALAVSIGNKAVPALTYVDRIIDLPIGIFAVSLGSVLMASMSRAAAENDAASLREQLNFSLRHVWFICAPLAAGIVFFHADVLRVLCLGGRYTMDDLCAARMVAVFYGTGIPLFCSLKVILPAFYARKQMKTPFYVSLAAITANVVCNLILMIPLKQGGLALATVISSLVNNTVLLIILYRQGFGLSRRTIISPLRSVILSTVCAAVLFFIMRANGITVAGCGTPGKDIILLLAISIAFGGSYLLLSALCRAAEVKEVVNLLLRRKKSS